MKFLVSASFWSSQTLIRHFVVYALPCLLCWSLYFLAYYPGMMSRDSLDQWHPIYTFNFDDWHPAFLSFLYWLLSRLWQSPAIICIAQMLSLSIVYAFGAVQLERFGLPKWGLALMTLFFCLFPINGFYVNTLFKDVPFAIAFLLTTIYLIIVVHTNGEWLKSNKNIILFSITLGFIWTIRHNGVLSVIAVLGVLLFVCWFLRKRIALLVACTLAMVFLVKGVLYEVINVHGRFFGIEMLLTHQIGAVLNNGTKLKEDEYRFIEKVLPMSTWQNNYDPFKQDNLVFDGNFNYSLFEQESARKKYFLIWFNIIKRNIPVLLEHQLKVTDLVWDIGLQKGSYNYAVHPFIDANDFGIKMESVLPWLNVFLTKAINFSNHNPPIRALLLRPATFVYINLILLILIGYKLRSKKIWLLVVPFLSLVLGLLLTIPAQHVRYLYPCFLVAPFFASYFFILVKKSNLFTRIHV